MNLSGESDLYEWIRPFWQSNNKKIEIYFIFARSRAIV